jgi:hypothetical protein
MPQLLRGLSMLAVLGLCLGLAGASHADSVLWNQGPTGTGAIHSGVSFADEPFDDFQFTGAVTINRIEWWGGRSGDVPVPDGFWLRIYESVFDTGLGYEVPESSPVMAEFITGDAGQTLDNGRYHYGADLSSSFSASAGVHYWLSIQGDLSNDPNGGWWGRYRSDTTNLDVALFERDRPLDDLNPSYYDLSFTLVGIPEPGTLLLLGSGLAVLATRRRRR